MKNTLITKINCLIAITEKTKKKENEMKNAARISAKIINAGTTEAAVKYTVYCERQDGNDGNAINNLFFTWETDTAMSNNFGADRTEAGTIYHRTSFLNISEAENFCLKVNSELEKMKLEQVRKTGSAEAELKYFQEKNKKQELYFRNAKGRFELLK
jgi:hypothetical protein